MSIVAMSLHAPEVTGISKLQTTPSFKRENTNFKNSKSQYTQEHEKSQTEHRQSRIRDVAEDPNLGTYSDRGF